MGLIGRQRALQRESFGEDPYERAGEDLARSFRDNVLAATDELHEALREVPGWKPWADAETGGPLIGTTEGQMVAEELADVQLFLWNLVLNCGYGDEDFAKLCRAAQDKTAARRRSFYEG